ncbi:MAG: hypothetical protein ACJARO_001692 [Bacteriovoracaceae bacterium]|jgi:hypothetical protein
MAKKKRVIPRIGVITNPLNSPIGKPVGNKSPPIKGSRKVITFGLLNNEFTFLS